MHFTVGTIGAPMIGRSSHPRYIGLTSPTASSSITIGANGLTKSTANDRSRNDLTTLKATREEVKKTLNKLNRLSYSLKHTIAFHYDERIEKIVAKVTDGTTRRVIRQIPSEELIRLSLKMDEFSGKLINAVI